MIYKQAGTGAKGSNLAYWQAFEYAIVAAKGKPNATNLLRDRKNKKAGCVNAGTQPKVALVGSRTERGERVVPEFSVRQNVWEYGTGGCATGTGDHPAPFPEALARDHILSWSNEGDIVLDPFSGSGTTAKMAKHNGRRFIGIEVNPEYVEISKKRLAQDVLF
tara:strand:- start:169 stop:657 length:489 start_codon:yes stop_codon:yes gene_type:complete